MRLLSVLGFCQLSTTDDVEIHQHARSLVQAYRNDLEDNLAEELPQFRSILKTFENEFDEIRSTNSVELFMFKLIIDKHLKPTFLDVEIMLRIYLGLVLSNATGERSFSRLSTSRITCVQSCIKTEDSCR